MNINNSKEVSINIIWLLFSVAAISFIFTLNLPHIGEEGVYTISSFEMWYNKHYLYPLVYGGSYGRPPLLNWFIIFLAKFVGWSHMLLASRLVTASATIGTGLVLAWLVRNIFHDARFAAFSALAYLTTDALIYHGWLAYADPLFGFCIFVAIACLWVAWEREQFGLLLVAILGLIAAFLTKALTAYAFYMVAFMVLLIFGKRKFLLHPLSIALHLMAISAPLLWAIITNNANGSGLIDDVLRWGWKAGQNIKITEYVSQLVIFPLEIFVRILPVSVIAFYYFWRGYKKPEVKHEEIAIKFLVLFIIISFFPYWISTKHSARYVLPLYPFMALWCSYIIWKVNSRAMRVTLGWFIAVIIIKYASVIFWWPNYQKHYRGDYVQVARDVIGRTSNYSLYTNDPGSRVLSVIDNVNIFRYPLSPVNGFGHVSSAEKGYFVFTGDENFNLGKIFREYTLGKSGAKLYLFCYGEACH